jgi:DNA-binding transcriptional MerR regulator
MAFDWNGFTPALTGAQQTALDYFETLGKQSGPVVGVGGTPNYTFSQTKAARQLAIQVLQKAEATMRGCRAVLEHYRAEHLKAFEEANQ